MKEQIDIEKELMHRITGVQKEQILDWILERI